MYTIQLNRLDRREHLITYHWNGEISIKDKTRFPFIDNLLTEVWSQNLPNGHFYAYIAYRFQQYHQVMGRVIFWRTLSSGPAGKQTVAMLKYIEKQMINDYWKKRIQESITSNYPIREKVFLSWIKNELPAWFEDLSPPIKGRIIPPPTHIS